MNPDRCQVPDAPSTDMIQGHAISTEVEMMDGTLRKIPKSDEGIEMLRK